MVRSREDAAKAAEKVDHFMEGACQLFTRTVFDVPSVGDVDGDGDADAVDGWKSEPVHARHPDDRSAPRGVPLAWKGGSHGFGHRAVSLGHGRIRSTDMSVDGHYSPGTVSTVTLDQIHSAMPLLEYLGWSDTMDGVDIPHDNGGGHEPGRHVSRVAEARQLLEDALKLAVSKGWTQRAKEIRKMLKASDIEK